VLEKYSSFLGFILNYLNNFKHSCISNINSNLNIQVKEKFIMKKEMHKFLIPLKQNTKAF